MEAHDIRTTDLSMTTGELIKVGEVLYSINTRGSLTSPSIDLLPLGAVHELNESGCSTVKRKGKKNHLFAHRQEARVLTNCLVQNIFKNWKINHVLGRTHLQNVSSHL